MLLSPVLGPLLFFYCAFLVPVFTLHAHPLSEGTRHTARWLSYFICLSICTMIVLHVPLLPMRYEVLIFIGTVLGYNDARAAHHLFTYRVVPFLTRWSDAVHSYIIPPPPHTNHFTPFPNHFTPSPNPVTPNHLHEEEPQ